MPSIAAAEYTPLPWEVSDRIAEARTWAGRYAALGWPVTPSCNGTRPWGGPCPEPDRQDVHAANTRWSNEATTCPHRLDILWDDRPSYGVVAALRGVVDVLEYTGALPLPMVLGRLAVEGLSAPTLRRALPASSGDQVDGEQIAILVAPSDRVAGTVAAGLTLRERYRPMPLPGSSSDRTHVRWAIPPQSPHLPSVTAVAAALRVRNT